MSPETYRALVVRVDDDGAVSRAIETLPIAALPAGEVLIRVRYSSLNYKDALSASGNRGVTRHYPHTPGIDAAGTVVASASADWSPGDEVVVTGFDLGMNTAGGFGQYIRVPADWVMARPDGLTLRQCMVYGTAGLTAALCVQALQHHGVPTDGEPVLVTGASGGVGGFAVHFLARAGYTVTAATGKADRAAALRAAGATDIVDPATLDDGPAKPLLRRRWAGAVDTVGGALLSTVLRGTAYGGAVAACGNAGGGELQMTVYPFILRAVALVGIASAECPLARRQPAWQALGGPWKPEDLDAWAQACALNEVPAAVESMLERKHWGRTVIDVG